MIFDEPTSALDPVGRMDVLALLRQLGQERSVVLSSHSLADVEKIADTVIVIAKGRVVYQGTLEHLLAQQERPVWRIRTHGSAFRLAPLLAANATTVRSEAISASTVTVEMHSMEAGERDLPRLLAESEIPIVEMTLDRLPIHDEAFAAIVNGEPAR
ncbi:MAG: hypothetical protein QM589_01555 [Thermomicrobiales bacterium]